MQVGQTIVVLGMSAYLQSYRTLEEGQTPRYSREEVEARHETKQPQTESGPVSKLV